MAPFDRSYTTFYCKYSSICIISEMKRYIGQKSRFFIPTCIQRPRYGGPRRSIAIPFGTKKREWSGYPKVIKI